MMGNILPDRQIPADLARESGPAMPDGTTRDPEFGQDSLSPSLPGQSVVDLRILATTDLHMHLLPYNYLADQPCGRRGLSQVARLIARMRRDQPNTLLFDNGDLLQGNPMGDYLAECRGRPSQPHPAIAAMNALGYDAAALGNHDFNYGLDFLRRCLAHATFPSLAANMRLRTGPQFGNYVILERQMRDRRGRMARLKIGVIGLLPPQTCHWDQDLRAHVQCDDIVETARRLVPQMRANGADLVVALAHCGIGPIDHQLGMENAATALARIEGVDAIVAGHTHQAFPGPDVPAAPGVDPELGTLAGKPAVMAGYGGSHLGVIDLKLVEDPDHVWRIRAFSARAIPVEPDSIAAPEIAAPTLAVHRHTLRHFRRRIGRTESSLNSYFSPLGVDGGLRLANLAQKWHVRQRLSASRWQHLPVLATSAPFRSGGRAGPDCFTNVPAGPLTLRSLADLYLFPNRICALLANGRQIRDWLERAAAAYNCVQPGTDPTLLVNPDFPGYNLDVIEGVSWQIDLTRPARYDGCGQLIGGGPGRVRNLRWQGRPVKDDDRFVLATNTYRLATCGLYAPLASQMPVLLSEQTLVRQALRHYVRRRRRITLDPRLGLRLTAPAGSGAIYLTSPEAAAHIDDLEPGCTITAAEPDASGYLRLSLRF